MWMKRLLSTALAALLSLSVLIACSDETPAQDEETSDTVVTSEAAVTSDTENESQTERKDTKDNLPADLTFDGQTLNLMYRQGDDFLNWNIGQEEASGDIVFDAVHERNIKTEERLGITINAISTQSGDRNATAQEISNIVLSASDEIDVFQGTAISDSTSLYPYLLELSKLDYLEIENPWWFTEAIMELSFDGEHYRFLMGDIMLMNYLKCGVIFYNKDFYRATRGNADPDVMYEVVTNGEWTWDAAAELAADAYADLNGNSQVDRDDQFGMMLDNALAGCKPHLVFSCDIVTTARTSDGRIDISPLGSERNSSVLDKLNRIIYEGKGVHICDQNIGNGHKYFAQDQSLFWVGRIENAATAVMREMKSDYGILPMPKYDENQEDYVTLIHTSSTMTFVPKSARSTRHAMIGAYYEAQAAESYRTVITPFIESAIKLKYSRDTQSGQVIDMVFSNSKIDFALLYNSTINSAYTKIMHNNISSGGSNFASTAAQMIPAAQASLDQYIKGINNADK